MHACGAPPVWLVSSETLNRALWELLSRGLIRRTREGKPGPFRLCALYTFTDLPTVRIDRLGIADSPATTQFASWVPGVSYAPTTKATKLAANPARKNTPLRKPDGNRFENRNVTAPPIGELAVTAAPELGAAISRRNARKPRQLWIPARSPIEGVNVPKIGMLYMSTRGNHSMFRLIGSTPDPADRTARVEVCLMGSRRPDEPPVIFVTKYRGCEMGERSVGVHPDIADDVAAWLRDAAAMCRAWGTE